MAVYLYYDSNVIQPAPQLTYNHELYYANDSIIGYTYVVSLAGVATHIRPNVQGNEGIEGNLDQIDYLKTTFAKNGVDLIVVEDGKTILTAKGSTVRSITFDQSANYYNNYVPYTIELEFNELNIAGCEETQNTACNSSVFALTTNTENVLTPYLVDINKYKIKSFTDSWDITVDDQIYNYYGTNKNNSFTLQYTINATGKNYYVDGKLVPAWHQARDFVQDRLYSQVQSLIKGIQDIHKNNDGCNPDDKKEDLYESVITNQGIIEGVNTEKDDPESQPNYFVYNETINCTTSESEGSFAATYSCILKESYSANPYLNAAKHTFNISKSYDQGTQTNASFSVQGQVEGLVRGGMMFQPTQYNLPQNGTFLVTVDSVQERYQNAKNFYYAFVGNDFDIFNSLKNDMDVTHQGLLLQNSGYASPQSFQLDHNFHDGIIGYNVTYSTDHSRATLNGYTNISVTRSDPVPKIQEFVVPGRTQGPIIQDLGMSTNRTVSINIDGVRQEKMCIDSISDICSYIPSLGNIPGIQSILGDREGEWVITKKNYRSNIVDGSFSLSMDYLCTGD